MILTNYQEIRDKLLSGDIVLMKGQGLISRLILWACSICSLRPTKYSHIGIVIAKHGRVMLLESTTLNGKNGVQLNALSNVLQSYKGQVVIRRLTYNRNIAFYGITHRFIEEMLGRPYEQNLLELIGATAEFVHVFDGHKNNLKTIFCSELSSEYFKRHKFLSQSIASNEYNPDDYRLGGEVDSQFRFAPEPVCLGEEKRVK